MVRYRLEFNTRDTERAFKRVQDRAPLAMMRALNKSIASARVQAARDIGKNTGLPRNRIVGEKPENKLIWLREARLDQLSAQLIANPVRVKLTYYGASGPLPSRGKGRGVTSKLKGGTRIIPGAFLMKMRSGHVGVMRRWPLPSRKKSEPEPGKKSTAWSKNLPVFELRGPSIVSVFEKYAYEAAARGLVQLKKNLAHELRWALGQIATPSQGATP
jgi:hypothetical protein